MFSAIKLLNIAGIYYHLAVSEVLLWNIVDSFVLIVKSIIISLSLTFITYSAASNSKN